MAMWAITQPIRSTLRVAGPGVSDWESYYGQTDVETWVIPYFGASAYDDPAIYAKSSPVRFVKNVHAANPLYVGNRDSICPARRPSNSGVRLKTSRRRDRIAFFTRMKDTGFTQPADQRDVTTQTLRWFDEHLNRF